MLRYFVHDDSDAIRMEIAGSLSGAEAQKAFDSWRRATSVVQQSPLIVDITYVTEADESGRAALREWQRRDARILASSLESRALLHSAGSSAAADESGPASAHAKERNVENAALSFACRMECAVR